MRRPAARYASRARSTSWPTAMWWSSGSTFNSGLTSARSAAMPDLEVSPRLARWIERNFEAGSVELVLAELRRLPAHAVGNQSVERVQASLVIGTHGSWRRF